MGLMQDPTSGTPLVLTPHPVTLEGQKHIVAQMEPGEKLGPFLARTVPGWADDAWEVRINGVLVPVEILDRVRPKEAALVEVRGVVNKQVLAIVAIAVLAYFTMGAGLALYAGAVGVTSAVGASVLGAVTFAAGSVLINKVLMPKPSSPTAQQSDPVYSIGSARNAPRAYEPLPLLFGTVRITPDVASMPYTWYEGNDQYLGMVLTPGINVHSVEDIYNGDTLLSAYEGATTYFNGLPGHADQYIPLYSNADTTDGGELDHGGTWVERTTSLDTVRIQINLEYLLGDTTSKGKPKNNRETVVAQYCPTGSGSWTTLAQRTFVSNNAQQTKRATLSADVARGQYDVRVHRLGQDTNIENAVAQFSWNTMTSVQSDEADYTGIPRIGVKIKATGQLSGALDEVRCVAHSLPVPVWNGSSWTTQQTSNPGAHLLAYARGIYDTNGRLLAGIGLPDSQIDIPSFQAFMVHCAANGYTYDAYIKDSRNHQEMVDAIALAGMGQSSWAGGKFGVVWADSAQPLTGVVNMATMKKGSFQVDYTLANAADGIEYTYIDPETWRATTLRVEAPGVTTMQNPARITGEGITIEAHAAKMARYHLAQHLYQYKDISYSADLEHLTYRRMSLLALSHDMTQWGYGGRLRAAVNESGTVTVTLDESVPAGATRYIGLRIPGEGVYRVFGVQSFSGESDTLTLVGSWPGDAPLPGDSDDNPAHDTVWIYDFKATPGYRVRVVQVEPEGDLKGARVAVVPESPEFWTYVNTGEYTPPVNQSSLLTRPVASNLRIGESTVVQGDTVFTELHAAFDVTGPMAYATIHIARLLDGEWGDLVQVAETRTQEARFRIPAAGAYRIFVRPFNADGIVGGVVSVDYVTVGADIPPPPFDVFDVEPLDGGIRKYSWAYNAGTFQAPDFAGAEIRYTAGEVAEPDWDAMTPVGDDGFHTAAFEAVVPVAGTWTFAARARNTSGDLSEMVVITRELAENLGEVVDDLIAQQTALDNALAQEAIDRFNADAATAAAAAADATAKANAALDTAQAQIDVISAQVADIVSADEWDSGIAYVEGDLVQDEGQLFRALQDVPAGTLTSDNAYWQFIGNYSSLGEAVAASIVMGTTNASDIESVANDLEVVTVRMPAGTGALATEASVVAESSARASADSAMASDISAVQARMPAGSGELASSASVISESNARVSADSAIASDLDAVEARMPAGTGALATAASVVAEQSARVSADSAISSDLSAVQARMPTGSGQLATAASVSTLDSRVTSAEGAITAQGTAITGVSAATLDPKKNLIANPECAIDLVGVDSTGGTIFRSVFNGLGRFRVSVGSQTVGTGFRANMRPISSLSGSGNTFPVSAGRKYTLSADIYKQAGNSNGLSLRIYWYNESVGFISATVGSEQTNTGVFERFSVTGEAPTGAAFALPVLYRIPGATSIAELYWTRVKFEESGVQTSYSAEASAQATSAATVMLDARVTSTEAGVDSYEASWTVALDVNGYVTGAQSVNNGSTSYFTISADHFRIINPGGGARLEWSDGNQRVYDANGTLRVRMGVW